MSHWDRVVLLELVDVVRSKLDDPAISDAQRQQLLVLIDGYAKKSQSIRASREDVNALEDAIARIAGLSDKLVQESSLGNRTATAWG